MKSDMKKQRLVVGITGSSGAVLGIRLLEALHNAPVETHLIVSPAARLTIEQETTWQVEDVLRLADFHYAPGDLGAAIASGSFSTMGMVVIPCSIKSLSAIANSYSGDLLTRAADVTLKEGRPLVLVVREAPLHAGHIRLMELAAQAGAVLFPPVPAFYTHPQTVDEIVDNIVGRVLNRIGIENDLYMHWPGLQKTAHLPANRPEEDAEKVGEEQGPAAPVNAPEFWDVPAMTLATQGASGEPHAATVYFAADAKRENLYFFSAPDSQHCQDLAAEPRAAAAIQLQAANWQEIRGLQIRGRVRPLAPGEDWEQAWACYLVKFPFAGALKEAIASSTLYTLQPDWVRCIDNRRGFGYKEEWTKE